MGWLNAVLAAVVLFDYAAGTLLVWNVYRNYPDHSTMSVFRWVALYAVAVMLPVVWSWRHWRLLRAKGLDADPRLRRHVFSPMVVGGITLLIALNLIGGR